MKVGRNLAKIRQALARAGKLDRAVYVERGTMPEERIVRLADKPDDEAAYFAVVLVSGGEEAAMTGRLSIVGLGPGATELITPLAADDARRGHRPRRLRALSCPRGGAAPASVGTPPTIAKSWPARVRRSILPTSGKSVAVVSSGDPGVFAMASAVFEAIESGKPAWRDIEVTVVPGVSAMLAAAARIGAPLGHDFCVISLSDNLKPWDVVLKRLEAAASGDFIIVLYNPASQGAALAARRRAPPDCPAPRSIDAGDLRSCREPARRAH